MKEIFKSWIRDNYTKQNVLNCSGFFFYTFIFPMRFKFPEIQCLQAKNCSFNNVHDKNPLRTIILNGQRFIVTGRIP